MIKPSSRRLSRAQVTSGQSLVEFALVLSLLVLFLFGILEGGRAVYAYSTITHAAREGAHFAITDPTNTAGIRSQVIDSAIGLGLTSGNVTSSCSPCTAGNSIRVDVTYNFQSVYLLVLPNLTLRTAATMYIE
ncbi:MAG: pilus assembly protein TadG [Chloroflexi bacterium HGW-Chloroflexi-1]|nr:MAG: pilus assembly protein TadG [Chloroflexi bacterium HGW-Chloroflexi-1]